MMVIDEFRHLYTEMFLVTGACVLFTVHQQRKARNSMTAPKPIVGSKRTD
jgi:hypothetical protein